jgi:hypothetical protein
MRTTLDIDDAALSVLRELGAREKRSIGSVASELILKAVRSRPVGKTRVRNGVPLLKRKPGVAVTNELIDQIREGEGV